MTARSWCFTLCNYTPEQVAQLDALECKRLCVGAEVAPTTGTPHLQGYFRFDKPVRLAQLRKLLPGAHLERRRGTESQATAYCRKEGAVLLDKGADCDSTEPALTRSETAALVRSDIDRGAPWGLIRRKYGDFAFFNRKYIMDYINDRLKYDVLDPSSLTPQRSGGAPSEAPDG